MRKLLALLADDVRHATAWEWAVASAVAAAITLYILRAAGAF